MKFFISCAVSALLSLMTIELSELGPWLAKCVVKLSARSLLDRELGKQYAEEWCAGIDETPGKLTPLVKAFGILFLAAPVLNSRYYNELWMCTIGVRAYAGSVRRTLRYPQWYRQNGYVLRPEVALDYNLFVDEMSRFLKEGAPTERAEVIEALQMILDDPPPWASKFWVKSLRRELPDFQRALSAHGYLRSDTQSG